MSNNMAYYNPYPQSHVFPQPYPVQQSQSQLHQQQQQHSYGVDPAAMSMPPPPPSMQPGISQQQQQQQQQQQYYQAQLQRNNMHHNPQSSAYLPSQVAFTQPLSSQNNFTQPPQHQANYYQARQTPPIPSPTHSQHSSSSTPRNFQQHPQPMASAAPPHQSPQVISQPTPPNPRPQNLTPQKPILQPPLSPAAASLESQRVTILLDINKALLQEIIQLQFLGRTSTPQTRDAKSAAPNPNGAANGASNTQTYNKEYIECMRRLQANLAYLAHVTPADRQHRPPHAVQPWPMIMETLPALPGSAIPEQYLRALEDMYVRLRELFPDYKGRERVGGVGYQGTGVGQLGMGGQGGMRQQVGQGGQMGRGQMLQGGGAMVGGTMAV